ncbi:MAG: NADH-quinone oxidoreductase subunit NuoH [Gemmatimonadaceae bacterium]
MTLPVPVLALLQAAQAAQAAPPQSMGVFLVATVMKMLIVFTIYLVGVAMLTLAERKISAWMQDRHGPNRVGKGWLQPAADGLKNIMKEETYPDAAYLPIFILAPMMAFIPALIAWAVIPWGAPWDSPWGRIELALAPLPIGFLYVLAITSIGVYGIVLAGWSSNNKYSLLGGIRSSAQMVSYEIAMGMATIPVLLLAGNVSLSRIVEQQAAVGPLSWNVATATIAWMIFLIAAFAETNRLPFDLPEAESELITGYHSEYSAMKFSMFFIAEYANMVTASALMAALFFGGWDIPFTAWDNTAPHTGVKTLLTTLLFFGKTLFFVFFYMWIRWTLPRFRYDQLMALGWKILLPVALAYIVIVASAIIALQLIGFAPASWQYSGSLFGLNVVLVILLFFVFDRGRLVSPASSRLDARHVQRLRALTAARMQHAPDAGAEVTR